MMNQQDFRYRLDSPRVTGRRQQKATCPRCGRRRCFVRYVDTREGCRYVADTVGRCDHEQSCGYHYTPSEYFRDQPWARPTDPVAPPVAPQPPRPVVVEPLPWTYVDRSHSPRSTFWQWLADTCRQRLGCADEAVQRTFDDYHLGATRQGDAIFWQIDEQRRVRSGHIMAYRTDGHRDGPQGWVHTRLQRQGLLRPDFPLVQCLYGLHLLPRRPDATVCIVESEKTALLMATVHPEHLWLATAGSSGLTPDKCRPLRGRRVVLFPDSGCLAKWRDAMGRTKGIGYSISDALEHYPPNTDLADLLLDDPAPSEP